MPSSVNRCGLLGQFSQEPRVCLANSRIWFAHPHLIAAQKALDVVGKVVASAHEQGQASVLHEFQRSWQYLRLRYVYGWSLEAIARHFQTSRRSLGRDIASFPEALVWRYLCAPLANE